MDFNDFVYDESMLDEYYESDFFPEDISVELNVSYMYFFKKLINHILFSIIFSV